MKPYTIRRWAPIWYSKNRLDGVTEHPMFEDCQPVLFQTRRETRDWIKRNCQDIGTRPDLRREPHGWRVPRARRVEVVIREARRDA